MRDYDKMSDKEVLTATLEGDEAAFSAFIRRYRNQITNYIHQMLDDYDRALDLSQETFVRVLMNVEQYLAQARDDFSTIIYKLAHNLAIEELRRRKRRKN